MKQRERRLRKRHLAKATGRIPKGKRRNATITLEVVRSRKEELEGQWVVP